MGTEYSNGKRLLKEINDTRINCVDFSLKLNKLVYGCSNGLLKVGLYKLEIQKNDLKFEYLYDIKRYSIWKKKVKSLIQSNLAH